MTRKTAVRLVPVSVLLGAALVGSGCGLDLDGLTGPVICTINCSVDQSAEGWIRMEPSTATLAVGQTIQVAATLNGPIVHFSSLDWRVGNRAVIEVQAMNCTGAKDDRRTCTARVTGLAPGFADLSVEANRNRLTFDPVYGLTEILVK
jgi:hypothetical protein